MKYFFFTPKSLCYTWNIANDIWGFSVYIKEHVFLYFINHFLTVNRCLKVVIRLFPGLIDPNTFVRLVTKTSHSSHTSGSRTPLWLSLVEGEMFYCSHIYPHWPQMTCLFSPCIRSDPWEPSAPPIDGTIDVNTRRGWNSSRVLQVLFLQRHSIKKRRMEAGDISRHVPTIIYHYIFHSSINLSINWQTGMLIWGHGDNLAVSKLLIDYYCLKKILIV